MIYKTEIIICPNCKKEVEVEFEKYNDGRSERIEGYCPECEELIQE